MKGDTWGVQGVKLLVNKEARQLKTNSQTSDAEVREGGRGEREGECENEREGKDKQKISDIIAELTLQWQ